jgi:hypothetical protein
MSPCVAQLNAMLAICSRFFLKWKIRINVSKSNFIQIGHNDGNHDPICMDGSKLKEVTELKFLGGMYNNKMDMSKRYIDLMKICEQKVYTLRSRGLQKNGVCPKARSYIFKQFCRSSAVFDLESFTLNKKTLETMNVMQNNCIRYFMGIFRPCHIRVVAEALKIESIEYLYYLKKLKFIESIQNNVFTRSIFESRLSVKEQVNSKSFSFNRDVVNLELYLEKSIDEVKVNACSLVSDLKKRMTDLVPGILDSVRTCLDEFDDYNYKSMFFNLIKL